MAKIINVQWGRQGERGRKGHLPMDGETVDEDWMALLGGRLAEPFEEDQDAGGLRIVQSCVVADDDIVKQDVDVGHLMRMERRHHRV
jgi:hypothetical protein